MFYIKGGDHVLLCRIVHISFSLYNVTLNTYLKTSPRERFRECIDRMQSEKGFTEPILYMLLIFTHRIFQHKTDEVMRKWVKIV